jgi:uncharacterized protein YdhG (YjbR/CyaY superfamily)
MAEKPRSTAEYLATLTEAQRATLARLRDAILAAAPGAGEAFSYGMPAFTLDGRPLLWCAAWKRHYSLYPIGPAIVAAHGAAAAAYETAKGTIRFPAAEALPYELVASLVRARVAELRAGGK